MHRSHRLAHRLSAGLALALAAGPLAHAADLGRDARGEAAAPFHLLADAATHQRARDCLAAAVYYEAGDQAQAGREAVAQVVLNRLRHPAFPKSVCAVVYQGAPRRGCQFSFACDGSAMRRPPTPEAWRQAQAVADRALDGYVAPEIAGATHYHALYVRPAWSAQMSPTVQVGMHRFYSYQGRLGLAAALTGAYAGAEADAPLAVGTLRTALKVASAPAPGRFSVWGLDVASATPGAHGAVAVAEASATSP